MYIIQVASEMTPVAKVGGLADVVYGLTRELERQGHAVEVILPKYDCLKYNQIQDLQPVYNDLWVPWYGGAIHCTVFSGLVHHVKCLFIDPHSPDNFFHRGSCYGGNDEYFRWAFFARAALEFMLKTDRRPDVIHCHDWQTGLLPVMLFEIYANLGMGNQRVCYTIHNFKHQGQAPEAVLQAAGLGRSDYYYSPERLMDHKKPKDINFMKGGIVYSNYVNTVSPHHAWEARFSPFGFGLNSVLDHHHGKFGGILNGLDYEQWNPATDLALPGKYTADNYSEKQKNKDALRDRVWLRKENKPLFAYIGRLDEQKGLPLIKHAAHWATSNGAQFVLLGSGVEKKVNDEFYGLKKHFNDNPDCHIEVGFSEDLARLIYSGADYLVVPSNFEPCGLAQLIALRYGTPPIVRYTGGLADTVYDWDHDSRPRDERNGFVFHEGDIGGLESALHRANGLWYSPEYYKQLAIQGMKQDFSWKGSAGHYINVYEYIRHK